MADPLLYVLDLAGHSLQVRNVRGREAVNEPFRFELKMHLPPDVRVDPDELVKEDAVISLARGGTERRITGLVSEVSVTETSTGSPVLRVTVEPRFALARHKSNVKAFLHKDATAIVSEVLGELGVAFELRLAGSYAVRPYTVQFRETDFHFVSRIMEEEGIFYWFDEEGTMVLADAAAAYEEVGAFPFRHAAGMSLHDDAITTFGRRARTTAGKVSLRDWTDDAPSRGMDVAADGPTPNGPEWYDFPGEYTEPGAGSATAQRIADALRVQADGFVGTSSVARLAPGRRFGLYGAPAGLSDGDFAVLSLDHDWDRDREGFSVAFDGVAADVPARAQNVHEEPILPNPLIGKVVGPPGADIHCDELGRVKVHLPWDRLQPQDDTCSHWVPVMQDNTGHSVGTPRIGWEVLVHFLEGDPDRPVVLGRVYNAEDPFHVTLPEKKTVTALRSLSSPTRDGSNSIEFDDLAGWEVVRFHAERDEEVIVGNNRTERVMNTDSHVIERNETIEIGPDEKTTVHATDAGPYVTGTQTVTIGGNRTLESGAAVSLAVGGNNTWSIGGSHTRRVAQTDAVSATSLKETVGGVILEASVKPNGTNAGKAEITTVGGAVVELAGKEKLEGGSKALIDTVGAVSFAKAKGEIKTNVDKQRVTNVGMMMKVKAKKEISLSASEQLKTLSAKGTFEAAKTITLVCGDSKLTLKDGQIQLSSKSSVKLKLDAKSDLAVDESGHN